MRDLRRFLLERLDEDEGVALETLRERASRREGLGSTHPGCWEPVRVLAECEAKRLILLEEPDLRRLPRAEVHVGRNSHAGHPEAILRMLAMPYSSHPDFDDRWRLIIP